MFIFSKLKNIFPTVKSKVLYNCLYKYLKLSPMPLPVLFVPINIRMLFINLRRSNIIYNIVTCMHVVVVNNCWCLALPGLVGLVFYTRVQTHDLLYVG